jgi:hypothetical protein
MYVKIFVILFYTTRAENISLASEKGYSNKALHLFIYVLTMDTIFLELNRTRLRSVTYQMSTHSKVDAIL